MHDSIKIGLILVSIVLIGCSANSDKEIVDQSQEAVDQFLTSREEFTYYNGLALNDNLTLSTCQNAKSDQCYRILATKEKIREICNNIQDNSTHRACLYEVSSAQSMIDEYSNQLAQECWPPYKENTKCDEYYESIFKTYNQSLGETSRIVETSQRINAINFSIGFNRALGGSTLVKVYWEDIWIFYVVERSLGEGSIITTNWFNLDKEYGPGTYNLTFKGYSTNGIQSIAGVSNKIQYSYQETD